MARGNPLFSPVIVARECKRLMTQGVRSADRRWHAWRHVDEGGSEDTLEIQALTLSQPIAGEKYGLDVLRKGLILYR